MRAAARAPRAFGFAAVPAPTVHRVGLRISTAAVLAVGLLLALALPLVLLQKGVEATLLCVAGILAYGTVTLPILLRSRYDIFEPITFVTMTALIGTTLKTFYIVFIEDERILGKLLLGQDRAFLISFALIIALGLLCLSVGYMTRPPRFRLEKLAIIHRTDWSSQRLTAVALLFLGISAASMVLYVRTMGIDVTSLAEISSKRTYELDADDPVYAYSSLGYLRWGVSLVTSVYYIFLVWFLGGKRRLRSMPTALLGALGTAAIFFPFLNDSRGGAARILLITLMIYAYMRRSIRLRTLAFISICVTTLIVTMSVMRENRNLDVGLLGVAGMGVLLENTIGGRHFLDLTKTAHIIDAIPEKLPYRYGGTFVKWIAAPVPRTLWPEKPIIGSGPLLNTTVFGSYSLYAGGVPPGFVAELYMNFGLAGIVLGMFGVGVLLRCLYRSFGPCLRTRNGVLLYCLTVLALTHGLFNGDAGKTIVGIVRELTPIILCLLIIARRPLHGEQVEQGAGSQTVGHRTRTNGAAIR